MAAFLFAYWMQLRLYNEEKQRHEVGPPKELHRWLITITGLLATLPVGAFIDGSITPADVTKAPVAGP
jgi:hypothetical protein